jgi:hypothetical protein
MSSCEDSRRQLILLSLARPGPDKLKATASSAKSLAPAAAGARDAVVLQARLLWWTMLCVTRGRPLDGASREFFEPRLGQNLENVRVHTDNAASDAARQLRASAFTVGDNIFFAAGQFSPDRTEGRKLLAHELVHTIQQHGSSAQPAAKLEMSQPGDALRNGSRPHRGSSRFRSARACRQSLWPKTATPARARSCNYKCDQCQSECRRRFSSL